MVAPHGRAGYLTDDAIVEILCRLPAKSVCRCKVVCHSWNDWISSSHFIKKHLGVMKDKTDDQLIYRDGCMHHRPLAYDPPVDRATPATSNNRVDVVGGLQNPEVVCHGLVLYSTNEDKLILENHFTKVSVTLPFSPIQFSLDSEFASICFGLGYQESTDNYKIVRLILFNTTVSKCDVSIYSRNTNAWTQIVDFPVENPVMSAGVYAHGNVHWAAYYKNIYGRQMIVSLSMEDYTYRTIQLPQRKTLDVWRLQFDAFGEETLILYQTLVRGIGEFEIWILEEYNNHDSWRCISIRLNEEPDLHILADECCLVLLPLRRSKQFKNKIFFRIDPTGICGYYDMVAKRFFVNPDEHVPHHYNRVFMCEDSLVSPTHLINRD